MTDNRGYPFVPGGGGGNPFDQSLNTVDDVKFNSTDTKLLTVRDTTLNDQAFSVSSADHYVKILPVYDGHGAGPNLGLDASGLTTYIEAHSNRVLFNTGRLAVDAASTNGGSLFGDADVHLNRRDSNKRARITFETEGSDDYAAMAVDDDTHALKIYNNNGQVGKFTYDGHAEFDNRINNAGGTVGDLLVGNGTSLVPLTRGPPASMLNVNPDTTLRWVHSESYLWKSTQSVNLDGFSGALSVIGTGVGPGLVLQQSWMGNGARLYVNVWGTYKNTVTGEHILYVTFNGTAYSAIVFPRYSDVLDGNFMDLQYHAEFQLSFTSAFDIQSFGRFHPQYQPYAHTTLSHNTHTISVSYPFSIGVSLASNDTFNRHTVRDLDVRVST